MVFGLAHFVQSLIYKVPDTAAYHALGMILYIVPILAEVTYSVAHGVCILAEEERFVGTVAVGLLHAFD